MARAPLPDLARTFVLAWEVLSRTWASLILISFIGWLPFGIVTWAWAARSLNIEVISGFLGGNWEVLSSIDTLVTNPGLLALGLVFVPLAWALSTCWVNGASTYVAHYAGRGVKAKVGEALRQSAKKLHRTLLVYLVITSVGAVLAMVALGAGIGMFLLLDRALAPLAALGLATLATLVVGALTLGLFLTLYARWAVASQAAVLDAPGHSNPLSSSASLTSGQRVGTLGRVLLLSLAVALIAGTISSVFAIGSFGPAWIAAGALLGRMLMSFLTGAGTNASVTPLYDSLNRS